ncbi:MAG: acyltransferase [Eubacterium sp.]|nr:acyltransferase [Eubacterium sp.]
MNENKINCLEGIRAIACIGVLLSHFRGAFLPGRYMPFIDNTPLRIMTAGNPMVRIMFVVSGFVISYKYFKNKQYDTVLIDVTKRWVRLFPAIFLSIMMVCLMMKCGLLFNQEAAELTGSQDFLGSFNQFIPNFFEAAKEGLFTTYLYGSSAYIGPLWTMVYEFMGTILILSAIAVFRGHYTRFLFYFISLLFFSSYFNYLIIGMLICDIYFNSGFVSKLKQNQILNHILLISSAIVLGIINIDDTSKFFRIVYGITLIIFFVTLLYSQYSEIVLGNKFMCKVGNLSFAIYIVHWPIIESFSSFYHIKMIKILGNYTAVVISNLLLTLVITIFISYLLTRYIVPLGLFSNEFWKKQLLNDKDMDEKMN